MELIATSKTLVEILEKRAQYAPDQLAYTFIEDGEKSKEQLTHAQLYRRAKIVASELQHHNLQGERAILLYRPGLEYVIGYFGCLMAGVIAVPVHTPITKKANAQLTGIITDCEATTILTTEKVAQTFWEKLEDELENHTLQKICTDSLNDQRVDEYRLYHPHPEHIAFLQYTSGSTSAPKGVMVSHSNLMHNLNSIREKFGHTKDSVAVIWLPPYHDMGLIGGILQPLYVGFPVILMSPFHMIQKPIRWLKAVTEYKATTSGGPDFSFDLCVRKIKEEDCKNLDLSSWNVAFSGGEMVRKETLDTFSERFTPYGFRKSAFLSAYGMAESTLIVSANELNQPPNYLNISKSELAKGNIDTQMDPIDIKPLVSSGTIVNGAEIQIVDPETLMTCEENTIGEIWLHSPSVTKGYIHNEEATSKGFEARINGQPDKHYLRSGDLGFIHKGELFITGRLKDMIIIRGENYYPQDIEWTVEKSHSLLAKGGGAVFSIEDEQEEKLVILHELVRGFKEEEFDEIFTAIRTAVAREFGLRAAATVLISPYSVLKTSSGKIRRQACKQAFFNNTLKIIEQKGEIIELA